MLNWIKSIFSERVTPSPVLSYEITAHSLIINTSGRGELLFKGMYCPTTHGGFVFLCPADVWPSISPWNDSAGLIGSFEFDYDLGWFSVTPEQFLLVVEPDHDGSPLGEPTIMGWLAHEITYNGARKIAGILSDHFDQWHPHISRLGEACYQWGGGCRYALKDWATSIDIDEV